MGERPTWRVPCVLNGLACQVFPHDLVMGGISHNGSWHWPPWRGRTLEGRAGGDMAQPHTSDVSHPLFLLPRPYTCTQPCSQAPVLPFQGDGREEAGDSRLI